MRNHPGTTPAAPTSPVGDATLGQLPPPGASSPGGELVPAPRRDVERYDIAAHQRVVRHRRARALPWKIGGTSATTGYAGWGAGLLAEALSGPLAHLAVTGGTGLTALAALAVLRYRHRDLLKDTDTAWYRRAGAGSVAWATASAALGPLYGMGALALAGWVRVTAQPWLRPQPPGDGPSVPPDAAAETPGPTGEAPATDEPSEGDRIRATLLNTVFGGGPLGGIELWSQTRLDQGWRWTAQFPEGTTFSSTARCEEMIAGALHTARNRVLWESVPTDVTQAVLTVTTVDLLARGVHYRGPEYHDGRIPLGELADGEGRAEAVVADDTGVHCIAFTGDKRKGKSTGQAAVLLGLLESGKWWTPFADGDVTKGSSPVLASRAAWPAAGPERILAQLCAMEGILEARQHAMPTLTRTDTGLVVPMTRPGQERVDKLLPGDAGFPGIMWFFDEFHRLINDPVLLAANFPQRLLAWLLLGAKYGMGGCAAAHSVHRSHWYSTDIFSAFAGRNHFAFYAHNNSEYVQTEEGRMSLNGLPDSGGYFLAPSAGRLVMGRTAHPLSVGDRVFTHPELHELDKKGAGEWLPTEDHDPHADYREAFDALAAWERDVVARRGEGSEEIEEDYSGYGDNVTPLRSTGPAPVPAAAGTTPSQQTRAAILAAVQRLGRCTNKQLHTEVPDVSPSSMTKHLTALSEDGLVQNLGYAGWAPAEQHRGTGS